jgi:hypothetical protein
MNEFHCEFAGLLSSIGLNSGEFPCIFPQNREVRVGDRFADDCLHRQFYNPFQYAGLPLKLSA